jgi:hypothetical protein
MKERKQNGIRKRRRKREIRKKQQTNLWIGRFSAVHGESLSGRSLTVSKDRTVIAVHHRSDDFFDSVVEDIDVRVFGSEQMIEGEDRIGIGYGVVQ